MWSVLSKRRIMTRESGRKWDGVSRIPNDNYKKRYDEIFKKKTKELNDKRKTPETSSR